MQGLRSVGFALGLAAAAVVAFQIGRQNPARGEATPLPVGANAVEPKASFHHVHLNVTDPAASIAYYERFFGANRIRYRDSVDALFTERSFILLNRVPTPPQDNFGTTFWHIGWAGVDGPSEFAWREQAGIGVQTPLTPLGRNFYMYFWGPDRELVEVYTGSRNHRFEHVHLLATDIEGTLDWFRTHLELTPNDTSRVLANTSMRINTIRVDNVNLIMFEVPGPGEERAYLLPEAVGPDFAVTEGRAMDHIAFSYPDLDAAFERMRGTGVEIVRGIEIDSATGLRSFFVRGPDGLLVEIVQEKPVPEGIWR